MPEPVDDSPSESHVVVHHRVHRTTDREDRQPVGEREKRQDREPEIGHRKKEEGDPAERVVSRGSASGHLNEGDENAECEAPHQRDRHQEQSIGQRSGEDFTHRLVVGERPPQLAVSELTHVPDELLWQWTIEAVLRAKRRAHALADVRVVHHRAERIARREMNERERDCRDDGDDHRGLAQPSREVAEHPLRGFLDGRFRRSGRGPSRSVVARDALVGRNPPLRDVRPPRVRSQRRELKTRMISDRRYRLGQPDGRRILDDRLVGSGEIRLSASPDRTMRARCLRTHRKPGSRRSCSSCRSMRAIRPFPTIRERRPDSAACSTVRSRRRRRAFSRARPARESRVARCPPSRPPAAAVPGSAPPAEHAPCSCSAPVARTAADVRCAHAPRRHLRRASRASRESAARGEIEGNLRKVGIGGRICAHSRSERGKSERVEDASHDGGAIGRHRQRAPELAIAEDGMRPGVIGRIAEVELRKVIAESPILFRSRSSGCLATSGRFSGRSCSKKSVSPERNLVSAVGKSGAMLQITRLSLGEPR